MVQLTVKQEAFCNYYIELGGNASEAYRRAYDTSNMKDETINRSSFDLLNDPKITARIKELQAELKNESDITKKRVLDELDAILDAKITDYIDLVTEEVALPQSMSDIAAGIPAQYNDVQRLVFKDFNLLTDKQVKAIESVKQGKGGIELKLHGKSWTIERICKMLGYDAPVKVDSKSETTVTWKEERTYEAKP